MLDREAEALLEEWARTNGTDLRSLGILNGQRRALVRRREVPLSRLRTRDEEEDNE